MEADPVEADEYTCPPTNPAALVTNTLIAPPSILNGKINGSTYQLPILGADIVEFVLGNGHGSKKFTSFTPTDTPLASVELVKPLPKLNRLAISEPVRFSVT